MPQKIEVTLSNTTYNLLKQAAILFEQPPEDIVAQSLTHSLPPLLEDIPSQYHADVYPLLQMSDAELQEEAKRTFPPERWAEYEALLERKKNVSLTPEEERRLDELRREADVLTFRRGYAAVLLKRRGYRLPSRQELEELA
jgi:hypothetical protein